MRGVLTILRANGERVSKNYEAEVPLADLQAAVGGYIETVPFFRAFEGSQRSRSAMRTASI